MHERTSKAVWASARARACVQPLLRIRGSTSPNARVPIQVAENETEPLRIPVYTRPKSLERVTEYRKYVTVPVFV